MAGGVLDGKVMVCTGGGSGIGRATVESFVAEGARVGVLELDPEKCRSLTGLGDEVFAIEGDATTAASNAELMEAAVERWGGIDVAATFVGIFDLYTALADIPADRFEAAYREVFDANVLSPLLTARAAVAALRARHGCIIMTLSSSSFYAGRGGTLYVASKFALRGVVTELAHELAPEVRVNGVAPGGTLGTDLRGPHSLGFHDHRLADRPGRAQELESRTPLQVALTPSDHTGSYVFLASDRARGITGEIIRSDGGLGVR